MPEGGTIPGLTASRQESVTSRDDDNNNLAHELLLLDSNSIGSCSDIQSPPTTPNRSRPPPPVRRFSVTAKTRAFEVTNYGPESVTKSPEEAVALIPARVRTPSQRSMRSVKTDVDSVFFEPPEVQSRKDKSVHIIVDDEDVDSSRRTTPVMRSLEKARSLFERGIMEIAKQGRAYAQRKKDTDRLVAKNGDCRIVYSKVEHRRMHFLIDFFTTMLELKWRYHFLLFAIAFALSWLLFGLLWWAVYAGDMRFRAPEEDSNATFVPCVDGVEDFATALLFSIETQHTIGYGTRAITPSCPLATVLLMLQSMFGVILQCILTGIIFAKMARPKRRAQTIMFSEKAVICSRDNTRCLMFRVGDMRQTQIIGATIQLMIAHRRVTKEGEYLPIVTEDLPVTTESGSKNIFLAWPIVVVHRIDQKSPIWDISSKTLIEKDWELIVVLEGVDEVTGSSFQVRTSYLPSEILWGHTLQSLFTRESSGGRYKIEYTDFHTVIPVNLPGCSARRASFFIPRTDGDSGTVISAESSTRGFSVRPAATSSLPPLAVC